MLGVYFFIALNWFFCKNVHCKTKLWRFCWLFVFWLPSLESNSSKVCDSWVFWLIKVSLFVDNCTCFVIFKRLMWFWTKGSQTRNLFQTFGSLIFKTQETTIVVYKRTVSLRIVLLTDDRCWIKQTFVFRSLLCDRREQTTSKEDSDDLKRCKQKCHNRQSFQWIVNEIHLEFNIIVWNHFSVLFSNGSKI